MEVRVRTGTLIDNPFKGCISCFACKLKNSKTNGLCAYNSYPFTDYSRYAAGMFDEKVKREHRENEFPKDLQKAYELGKRLAEKAAQ